MTPKKIKTRQISSAKECEDIITSIHDFLSTQPKLSFGKKMKLFCYYTTRGTYKKLLFYLNPRSDEVIFGIGHRGTDILEKFPLLPSIADETKASVMKFSLKNIEDIEKKGIHKLIELILQ